MEKIIYTKSDIDLLCQSVGNTKYLSGGSFREVVENIIDSYRDNTSTLEVTIHSMNLEKEKYHQYEPYGEAKYFVIFDEQSHLRLEFWTRHLKKFLFNASLREMPLLINMPFICILASWRLRIGK